MSKVVTLTGEEHIPPGQPVPQIIEKLKIFLKDAEEGKLRNFAIAALDGTGAYACDWYVDEISGLEILGCLNVLGHRILCECEAGARS